MKSNKPRILLYDIETSPNISYTWGKWEQDVLFFKKEWELLSFAYKWLGEKKVHCIARPDFKDTTEKSIVKEIWKLFDEADILIAHNGDQFDNKKCRAKFIEYNLPPPSLYNTIDTKKIAKQSFNFNSNSLNDIAKLLKLGTKVDTGGFELWLKCMAGDKIAWDRMVKYNKKDVLLLERVYLKFRSWMKNHPNVSKFFGREGCPTCGSLKIISNGFRMTAKGRQQKWQCQECGHYYTGKLDK